MRVTGAAYVGRIILRAARRVRARGDAVASLAVLVSALAFPALAAKQPQAGPAAYHFERHAEFKVFFEDFRRAVLADDRDAVVRMTALPFRDFGALTPPLGNACLDRRDPCTPSERRAKRTSEDARQLRLQFDRVFSPGMREALRLRQLRGAPRRYDENYDGPIDGDEWLLAAKDIDDQRVFARTGRDRRYRMVRIPFYP